MKLFPNLGDGAKREPEDLHWLEPRNGNWLDPNEQWKLVSFADGRRKLPEGSYIYVVSEGGRIKIARDYRHLPVRIGHVEINRGHPVRLAGEIEFAKRVILWWNNKSGHYEPWNDYRHQARLPPKLYLRYDHVRG